MALSKNQTPAFEAEDEINSGVATDMAPIDTVLPAAVPTTAVAVAAPAKLALKASALVKMNILSDKLDALHVEYDSLPSVVNDSGDFVVKGTTENIGTCITLDLHSYQYQWVVSPGDKEADMDFVKYSDDGVISSDGVMLAEHLDHLKAQGFSKAQKSKRVILVGELLSSDKPAVSLLGELIQINLSETGRKSFDSHTLQMSFKVGKGRISAEDSGKLKITSVKAKSTTSGSTYHKSVVSSI